MVDGQRELFGRWSDGQLGRLILGTWVDRCWKKGIGKKEWIDETWVDRYWKKKARER